MTAFDRSSQISPALLALTGKEVHVSYASLERSASQVQLLAEVLSVDERLRAHRFHFERDRQQFIVRRGLLRIILGSYLGATPDRVLISYGHYGKPELADAHDSTLRFNLSHSHGLALYAVTYEREIGVDVEWIRPIAEAEQIAERFFSARENAALRTLPTDKWQEAFFNCWTRKEAYIKARGEGLSTPLDQFEVSLVPGEPAELLNSAQHPEEAMRWSLHQLTLATGYVAALAIEGHDIHIKCAPWHG